MKRGYYGIGCIGMKTSMNYGSLFRTAQVLGVDFLFLIGKRFKKQASDTYCSYRHIPVFEYIDFDDFQSHRPYSTPLVSIELDKNATMLNEFKHPKQAIYLLGAEDNGIPREALNDSQHIVQIPGERSLNVAVAGSIVIYDRISKHYKNENIQTTQKA